MVAGAAPQVNVMTEAALMAACSAAAVQLAGVPLPTTRAPAMLAWPLGAVQTAGGAARALAVAATLAAPKRRPRSGERNRKAKEAGRCMGQESVGRGNQRRILR